MIPSLRPHQIRGVDVMRQHNKGQVIVPTGGGKTLTMITDALREFQSETPQTIVVVCPRILLAGQLSSEFLEFILNSEVLHIHSGETHHESTTNPGAIRRWVDTHNSRHQLIFTTYNSLQRLVDAEIDVDTIYFDEAHNSVKRNFFPATEYYSANANRCYFFTATPKHSVVATKPGMNHSDVYGNVICQVPAPELVNAGYILPPKVVVHEVQSAANCGNIFERDKIALIDSIDEHQSGKILICAKATKQIVNLISQTNFCSQLESRGYSWMYITAKTGAVIDGKKVNREIFFDTLNAWGKDSSKKFVVIHHSILSEGINVNGLEGVLFMRNMDFIGISQTIGRVIRLGGPQKTFGLVVIPVFDKVGIATAKSIQTVVNTIFINGEAAVSTIKR